LGDIHITGRRVQNDILTDFYDVILHEEVISNVSQLCFRKRCLFEQVHAYFVNDLCAYSDGRPGAQARP